MYYRDIFAVYVKGEELPEESGLFPIHFEGQFLAVQYVDIVSDYVWTEAQRNGSLSKEDLKLGKTSWANKNKGRYNIVHHKLYLSTPVPGETITELDGEPKTMAERILGI